jgi:hypothetical protein
MQASDVMSCLTGALLRSGRSSQWGDGQSGIRLKAGVRNAADMPELEDDRGALGMDGVDHFFPAFGLCVGPGQWRLWLSRHRDNGRRTTSPNTMPGRNLVKCTPKDSSQQ